MKKYVFDSEINKQLDVFFFHLKEKGFNDHTVMQHSNYAGIFLKWLCKEQIDKKEVRYNEIIAFINYLQNEDYNTGLINRVLLAVRHLYESLNYDKNPASNIFLRGKKRLLPTGIISYDDLKDLYLDFETKTDRQKRNKTILGLMIFQALTPGELLQLEPEHIKLKQVKIHIPLSKYSNARVLELNALQLLDIYDYIQTVRPRLLDNITNERAGRKPQEIEAKIIENQLFFSENGSKNLKSSLFHLFKAVKKQNPEITSCKIIRQSVIAHWVKQEGIRKVQYMAGFKRVESAQRYRDYNMDELSNDLRNFHPLGS